MATASTLPTVKTRLVTRLAARDALAGVQVAYAWPGVETEGETIFLDPPDVEHVTTSEIPTMKAGRKAREESYTVVVTIQVFDGTVGVDDAATVEARAFALLAELDGELADDPNLGLSAATPGPTCRVSIAGYRRSLATWHSGWVARLDVELAVDARLS